MAITIKELLASDTVSQAVDKINFNFDQLLLNGGGPVGPLGPQGVPGPVGGRGIRGTKWYEDPTTGSTGTDPNTLSFTDLNDYDVYLQKNGIVWSYNGTVWVVTSIDLTGPQGIAGSSATKFNYFGNPLATGEQALYPIRMPNGTGATINNEGIPMLVVGGVPSNADLISGIPLTDAYEIPDVMSLTLDSSLASMLVHQKNASATAIKFMGGGYISSEHFEQSSISLLSSIGLGTDDTLIINVPKPATSPSTKTDLIGFEILTQHRGQYFYAGKHIEFTTGNDTASPIGGEISDYIINIETSNPSIPAKLDVRVNTSGVTNAGIFQLGGNVTLSSSSSRTGKCLIDTGQSRIVTKNANELYGNNITLKSLGSSISLQSYSDINIQSGGTSSTLIGRQGGIGTQSAQIKINNYVAGTTGLIQLQGKMTWNYQGLILNPGAESVLYINIENYIAHTSTFFIYDNTREFTGITAYGLNHITKVNSDGVTIETGGDNVLDVGLDNTYTTEDRVKVGVPIAHDEYTLTWDPSDGDVPFPTNIQNLDPNDKTSYINIKIRPDNPSVPPSNYSTTYDYSNDIDLGNGHYEGQRLFLRVTVMPIYWDAIHKYEGTITINARTSPSWNIIGTAEATLCGGGSTGHAQETWFELIWTNGLSITTVTNLGGTPPTIYGGWRVIATGTIEATYGPCGVPT